LNEETGEQEKERDWEQGEKIGVRQEQEHKQMRARERGEAPETGRRSSAGEHARAHAHTCMHFAAHDCGVSIAAINVTIMLLFQ